MNINKQWIYDHNKVMAPVLAVIFSVLASLLAIYTVSVLIFILVPAVTFFTFHYTKLYKMKLRLLGSLIVFIVVMLITVGMLTSIVYYSQPTYKTQFLNSNGNETGSTILASVTPYSGTSQSFTFNFYIVPNGTFDYNSLNLNIKEVNGQLTTVHYSQMHAQTFTGNLTERLTYTTSLPAGLYSYNLTTNTNGTLSTPSISGPLNSSFLVVYEYLLPTYAVFYTIIFELVFLIGIFVGRSVSNSRRYSQQRPPQQGDKKQP